MAVAEDRSETMQQKRHDRDEPTQQRKRAEEIFRRRALTDPENAGGVSPEVARQVLYELRVHQIQLEMQNEELRRAQQELEGSRARYFDLYDLAPVGYVTINELGRVVEANLTATALLGVGRSELVRQPLTRFIHPEDQDIYFGHRKQLVLTRKPQVCELRLMKRGGDPFWVRLQAAAPQELDGTPVYRTVLSDITDRKRAEETLRASETRHRLLFERSHDALMTLTPPGWTCTSVNATTIAMFGAPDQASFLSRTPWHHSPRRQPDGRESENKAEVMIETAMREGSHLFEWTFVRLSGEEFVTTVVLTRMEIDGQPLLQATVRDETQMKRLQGLLSQSDRLASMGMLAAGVAHEINNPLAYLLYNVEALADDLPGITRAAQRCCSALSGQVGEAACAEIAGDAEVLQPAKLEDAVERAREALAGALRIKNISKALGTFSRVERVERSVVDLNYAIECAITMAFNEIKFRARLVKELGPVPPVWASEGKLSQVFLNLLINASHAIDEGRVESNRMTIRTWAEGSEVFVEIKDTGRGIPEENLSRIFEPFFTTKPPGAGSGLGLAICRNIVTEFGGDIRVESEVGKGTRFVIRLPAHPDGHQPPRATPRRPPPPVAVVPGRILVVDDEELLLRALKRRFSGEHEVVPASCGQEARTILEHDQSFDVILCDLMMPEMTGMDLHAWLATHSPSLTARMVFVTGGAFTPMASEYLAGVPNRKLDKPLDGATLKRLVSELVAAARAPAGPESE
jgi:PAS domain S-box-containing protein